MTQSRRVETNGLAYQPFDPISLGGRTDGFSHRDHKSGRLAQGGEGFRLQHSQTMMVSPAKDPCDLFFRPQPRRFGKPLGFGHFPRIATIGMGKCRTDARRRITQEYQADKRVRPLARRRFNTRRPAGVFMRARNPCFFFRLRVLG